VFIYIIIYISGHYRLLVCFLISAFNIVSTSMLRQIQ